MREILFKAKRADNGEWVEGCYVKFIPYKGHAMVCAIQPLKDDGRMEIIREVIPETVSQYTGLEDKNGEKIFEGDICKDGLGWVFEVIWDGDNGRFLGQHLKSRGDTYVCYVGRTPAVEVIGNIHDNPEMLGGE